MSTVVPVVIAVVALAMILLSRKHVTGKITVRAQIDSPERFDRMLESPQVQEQLRAAGIDPAALRTDIHEGTATFEGGKLHVTKTFTTATASLDSGAPLPPGAHPLSPQEASVFTRDPAFLEALRSKGIDPEQFARDVAAGKVMGTFESHTTGKPPAQELHAPPSEAGDDIWKKGEL